MRIQREDIQNGCCRLVTYQNVVHFTGHGDFKHAGFLGQATALSENYEKILKKYHMCKEGILMVNIYLKNIEDATTFVKVWQNWIDEAHLPSGTIVQAPPMYGKDHDFLLEVQLIVALNHPKILKYGKSGCFSTLVIHQGIGYFAGQMADNQDDLGKESRLVLAHYEQLFQTYHLKKENLLMANIYIRDENELAQFDEQYFAWLNKKDAPTAVAVEAKSMHQKQVTIAFIIATEDAKIERFDPTPGFNRIVKYNGWVYFVGHCANGKDVTEQTKALCNRYEEYSI